MEFRSHFRLIAALPLLGLAAPVAAQQDLPSPPPPLEGEQRPGQPGQFPPGGGPQFGPGGTGPFAAGQPPMGMPMQPELAKKTAIVMTLRQIQGLNLSANDLKQTISVLKRLHDAETALTAASNRALDEEIKVLLTAAPGTPPRDISGERMQRAAEQFGQQSEEAWQSLGRAIGDDRAGAIRNILGGGMMGLPMGGGPIGPGAGGRFAPQGGPGGGAPFGGPNQPGQRPGSQGRRGRGGQGLPNPGGQPGQPGLPPDETGGPDQPGVPAAGDQFPPGGNVFGGGPDAPGFDGQQPSQPPAGRRGQGFGPVGFGGQGFGGAPAFGRGGGGFGGPQAFPVGAGMPFAMQRVTLAELIELLSQKLAAMPK